jgi:hypothetical protein
VDRYKYLGVVLNDKGDFSYHCEALAKGAGRALGNIISKIHNYKDCGYKSFTKLFESCVIPILDYCASVWGFKHYQSIDNIQYRAIRYYLGVHRFAPKLALTGDTGWLPSNYRRWISIIRYWNRLILFNDNRITKRVFNMDYNKCSNNWCSDVKTVMTKLNLVSHFENKTVISLDYVKTRITQYYTDIWKTDIQKVPKLRTYVTLKDNFITEKYVQLNLNKNERSMLSQFRCGILPLRIETGRYISETPEQRICLFCPDNKIEDEKHFLVQCPFYNNIRVDIFSEQFMNEDFMSMNDDMKMKYLVVSFPRKVAKYLVNAYCKRKKSLFNR